MRLTTRTNLALRALMYCAENSDRLVRTAEVAAWCQASENHLGQVINALSHAGHIETVRGRGGGFRLARVPGSITIGAILRVLENAEGFTDCFETDGGQAAPAETERLREVFVGALDAFYGVLDEITISDLVDRSVSLEGLFAERSAAE